MYRVCPNCDFSCVEYYAPPVCPWCRGARGQIVQLEGAAFHPRYVPDDRGPGPEAMNPPRGQSAEA